MIVTTNVRKLTINDPAAYQCSGLSENPPLNFIKKVININSKPAETIASSMYNAFLIVFI